MARINTNVSALTAQRGLAKSQKQMSDTLQRLSTGLRKIKSFDASDLPAQVAGEVPTKSETEDGPGYLDINKYIEHKEQKKMDLFIHYGVVAAADAVEDSGWKPEDYESQCRTGVLIGSAAAAKPKPKASPKPSLSPAELPSPSSSTKKTDMTANPLLTESTLPYKLPPFDKIKDEHFQPALEQGMAEEEKDNEHKRQQERQVRRLVDWYMRVNKAG